MKHNNGRSSMCSFGIQQLCCSMPQFAIFILVSPLVNGLNLQIMVTTKLASVDRRSILRFVFGHCMQRVGEGHSVEQLFFLGEADANRGEAFPDLTAESEEFGDLVFVGGPDTDPWVPRDATYVLDRPTSRGYRLAYGTAWLAQHRPDLDMVMYLDDDSYLHIPRLLQQLEQHNSESLAMGFAMETPLDMSKTSVCDVCNPCEPCLKDQGLREFCEQFPDMALGGCLVNIQQCQLFNDDEDMMDCVRQKNSETIRVASYFGSASAPRWFLGMGWVFGRRIVQYLARNVDNLKKRGAADVQLGFWLAPLEDIDWVDMKDGFFHDYPMQSTFSHACTEKSILVHRMNETRWQGFKPDSCELHCPASA